MLSNRKINDMWRAGYCMKVIDHARTTENTVEGSARRMMFLTKHVETCENCRYACMAKEIEHDVAAHLGPKAERQFLYGEDPRDHPMWKPAIEAAVRAVKEGRLAARHMHYDPEKVFAWMQRTAEQRREPLVPEDDDD